MRRAGEGSNDRQPSEWRRFRARRRLPHGAVSPPGAADELAGPIGRRRVVPDLRADRHVRRGDVLRALGLPAVTAILAGAGSRRARPVAAHLRHAPGGPHPPGLLAGAAGHVRAQHHGVRRGARWTAAAAAGGRHFHGRRLALGDAVPGRGQRAALVDQLRGHLILAAAAGLCRPVLHRPVGRHGLAIAADVAGRDRPRSRRALAVRPALPRRYLSARLGLRTDRRRQILDAALQPVRLFRHVRHRRAGRRAWPGGFT